MELVWRGSVEFNGVIGSIGVGQVKVGSSGECMWVEAIMASPTVVPRVESKHVGQLLCVGRVGVRGRVLSVPADLE